MILPETYHSLDRVVIGAIHSTYLHLRIVDETKNYTLLSSLRREMKRPIGTAFVKIFSGRKWMPSSFYGFGNLWGGNKIQDHINEEQMVFSVIFLCGCLCLGPLEKSTWELLFKSFSKMELKLLFFCKEI